MAVDESDIAARLIEQLLADPAFRDRFRRDPVRTCREAGLDEIADDLQLGGGKAMHTLDLRESRSSLAGVMMAAAMEGIGIYEFSKHVVPHIDDLPRAVGDVLSRVDLPALPGGGALAGAPKACAPLPEEPPEAEAPAAARNGAAAAAAPAAAPAAGAAPLPSAAAAKAAASAAAPELAEGGGQGGAGRRRGGRRGEAEADAVRARRRRAATGCPEGEIKLTASTGGAEVDGKGAAPVAPAAPAADAPAPAGTVRAEDVDPATLGQEGTGGKPTPEGLALLENKNIVFDDVGVSDIKAGKIDPRVIGVLTKLSQEHKITVSCMCSDHDKFTAGGSVSNHSFGRGLDIAAIDGEIVSPSSPLAREIASELSSFDPSIRPDEIGSPVRHQRARLLHRRRPHEPRPRRLQDRAPRRLRAPRRTRRRRRPRRRTAPRAARPAPHRPRRPAPGTAPSARRRCGSRRPSAGSARPAAPTRARRSTSTSRRPGCPPATRGAPRSRPGRWRRRGTSCPAAAGRPWRHGCATPSRAATACAS